MAKRLMRGVPKRVDPNRQIDQEIEEQRRETFETRRATVEAIEKILYERRVVLDHGFVRVIDYMGDDAAVVQAARVSYGKGTKQVSDDRALIRYLLRHNHTTPFEMCEIKLHVKLPIFVARQWVRHRTANINEYSARYSVLDNEFYIPDAKFLEALKADEERKSAPQQDDLFLERNVKYAAAQSTANKQGRERILSHSEAEEALRAIETHSDDSYKRYQDLLNEREGQKIHETKMGLARELARIVLPTNIYTQWYWKIDLHNLLRFLNLRTDGHAQYEIRAYADCIMDIVRDWVPITAHAFEDYQRGAVSLSAAALALVKRLLAGERVTQAESGLGKREWTELMATLGRPDGA